MTPEPLMVMGQVELFPVILLRRQQLHGASLLLKIMEFFIPSTVAAQVGIGVQ